MFPFFVLFFLLVVILSVLTTIPLAIVLLVVATVLFKKSWVFSAAFLLGLFLDLTLIRPLGYTSLMFAIFVFVIRLYEKKFETQTGTFVFFAVFLGSLIYLKIFDYQEILMQLIINSLLGVLTFKAIQKSNVETQK